MNIKKHYKIIISIIIIIILISSVIIYVIPRNNITYNNNGEYINVKYFSSGIASIYIKHNYTASSCYPDNNKLSYMNSTIIQPYVYLYKCLLFGINIHLKNINSKYLYVYVMSKTHPESYRTCLSNLTFLNSKYINNVCEIKYKINGNNMLIHNINIHNINNYIIDNKYYNTSIKIELNNHFYNIFDINTIKETTIYGSVLYSNLSADKINTSLLIENTNNSNYKIMHVINGYFYCFLKPDTEYKLYNSNLTYIYTVDASNLTAGHSFNFEIPSSSI